MREFNGHNGSVTFDGQFLIIKRTGMLARVTVGTGEKQIPHFSIRAVRFKRAGVMFYGYIEFTLTGENKNRSKRGSATKDAAANENALLFTKKQMPEFEALRREIEAAIVARRDASIPAPAQPNAL